MFLNNLRFGSSTHQHLSPLIEVAVGSLGCKAVSGLVDW